MPDSHALDSAILRTVLYADVFDFAMTVRELHHFLLHTTPVPLAAIEQALTASPLLAAALGVSGDYIALRDRAALFDLRRTREAFAADLWPLARRYGRALGGLPFVRMVALTGALAMRNPTSANDDLDYLIVTQPGRVWLARLLAVMLVRWVKLRGTLICPNFVLAEDALAQRRRDVYIAHEVAQAVPLYDAAQYHQRLRDANHWTFAHLPNASGAFHDTAVQPSGRLRRGVKHALEWALNGWLGDRIEAWEKARKLRRFQAAAHTPHSAARVDESQVKGHFQDHGSSVLAQYRQRLVEFGLTETADSELAAD